jgi:thiamine transporter
MARRRTQILTEGGICIALALALSYVKIKVGAQGGSISFVMIPLIFFAVHSGGVGWGVIAGLAFGTLKFFLGGGSAISWQSMLLDYSLAYAAVGVAGVFRGVKNGYIWGALIGSIARFAIHYISGVTIYAQYAEATYLGVNTAAPWLYSLIYNGFYMLFSTLAAVILTPILAAVLEKALPKRT